jgi:hypothetical protein
MSDRAGPRSVRAPARRPQLRESPSSLKRVVFHVTYASELESISSCGLLPSIGPRAKLAGETQPRVYLFRGLDDVEGALTNWLGDVLTDDRRLALLMVDVKGLSFDTAAAAGYELAVACPIEPWRVSVITSDLDEAVDLEEATLQALGRYDECLSRLGGEAAGWFQLSPVQRWELALEPFEPQLSLIPLMELPSPRGS